MPTEQAVLAGYQTSSEALRTRALAYVQASWAALGTDYSDASMARFTATIAPYLEGVQARTASLTDAYLAALESAVLDVRTEPVGVSASKVSTRALRGVPAREVWQRPAHTVWTELGKGLPPEVAGERGLARAIDLTETGVQLSSTHTTREVLEHRPRATGYRRVPRGGRSCALCLLAATQTYHKKDLMPIHPGCHCKPETLYDNADPGPAIHPSQLDAVYASVGEFTGKQGKGLTAEQYRQFVVVHDHGEIGPVLGVRGQKFTGPDDIP